MRLLVVVLLALVAAGCVAEPAVDPAATSGAGDALLPRFPQSHDHADAAAHGEAVGMRAVGYHSLAPGGDGADASARGNWLNSEVVVRGDHAYVGHLGGATRVSVVDIADPSAPRVVGTVETAGAWTMDVDASDDGDWLVVSLTSGAVGTVFARDYLLQNPELPTGPAAPGLLLVDARDRAAPEPAFFLPIHGLGPHTAVHHEYPDGREVVFANKAEGGVPGNAIVAVDVVDTAAGRILRPLSAYQLPGAPSGDLPHDVDVQEHPLTGRTLLYAAWWDSGLVVLDVTDPAAPALVSRFADFPEGEKVQQHDVHPFPRLAGGRHYTLTAPEILTADTTGELRVFDTTDPAAPALVGSWRLPGDYVVDEMLVFSPHNFQFLPDGRVALAHGHAGVWIVDWLGEGGADAPDPARIAAPQAVAYAVPHAPGAPRVGWTPMVGAPWAWGTAVDARGLVWVSDVASGLHGFEVDA